MRRVMDVYSNKFDDSLTFHLLSNFSGERKKKELGSHNNNDRTFFSCCYCSAGTDKITTSAEKLKQGRSIDRSIDSYSNGSLSPLPVSEILKSLWKTRLNMLVRYRLSK